MFGSEDVARPFVTYNAPMLEALVPYLRGQLAQEVDGVLGRVRAVLLTRIRGQRVTVRSVGKELGMSTRALQRALSEAGTSFRDVLDDVRNQQALRYLSASTYSDGEITFLLGFENPRSFYRAFRAWNKMSPGEYREAARSSVRDARE